MSIKDLIIDMAEEAVEAGAMAPAMARKAQALRLGLATPRLDAFLREEESVLEVQDWLDLQAFEAWKADCESAGDWLEAGDAPQWRQDLLSQELLDELDELVCLGWYLATHASEGSEDDEHRLNAADIQSAIMECHEVLEENAPVFRGQTALAQEMLRQWKGHCPAILRQWSDHWRVIARLE